MIEMMGSKLISFENQWSYSQSKRTQFLKQCLLSQTFQAGKAGREDP